MGAWPVGWQVPAELFGGGTGVAMLPRFKRPCAPMLPSSSMPQAVDQLETTSAAHFFTQQRLTVHSPWHAHSHCRRWTSWRQ